MSLRTRVLASIGLIALALVAVLAFVAQVTESNLIGQVDEQLLEARGRVRDVGRRPAPAPGAPAGPVDEFPDDPRAGLSPLYVADVIGDDVVTRLQPGLRVDDLPLPDVSVGRALAAAGTGEPFTASSQDADLRWRVLADPSPTGDDVRLIALPLEDVDSATTDLVRVELAGGLAILLVLALVAFWVVRLGIRPVRDMTDVATLIAAGDLSQRVPDVDDSTEAGQLGAALNAMLGSIEESFDERRRIEGRLRQFVADASHELRTPVATIRGYAELYRVGALDQPDALDDAMRRTEQEAVRMGGLIEDLLSLARLDQRRPLERTTTDLAAVAEDAVRDARAMAPDRRIGAAGIGPVTADVDEPKIRQIVANLVGNALVHTPADASITVRTGVTKTVEPFIEVADDGPGMELEVAERAFERFYRAEESRARHSGGSGLGLSIVDATVRAHGGHVHLDTSPGRGTTVRVTLPHSG